MGWYKAKCSQCWDSHPDQSCDDYQRQQNAVRAANETNRLLKQLLEQQSKGNPSGKKLR